MKKKALWKDIFKEMGKSKTRFLSIFIIITLGVAFFAGIKATGPDMIDTANQYYEKTNLMDTKVVSTYGLNEDDKTTLESIEGANVTMSYSQDVIFENSSLVAKLMSYSLDEENPQNKYIVDSGRLPEKTGEIALDNNNSMTEAYKIGDTVTLTSEDDETTVEDSFATSTFKVVGFVTSPQYIENSARGTSTVGKGTVDGFAVIPEEDFTSEFYTEAYLTFAQNESLVSYSSEYEDNVEKQITDIEEAVEQRPEERLAEIRSEAQIEIDDGQAEIDDAKQQLADGQEQLDEAKATLDQGRADYNEGLAALETQTANAQATIDQKRQELEDGRAELAANEADLQASQAQLIDARANFEAQKVTAEQSLANGETFVENARAILTTPIESVPVDTQTSITQTATSLDPTLGEAFTGYFAGVVPSSTVSTALDGVVANLEETRAQINATEAELSANEQRVTQGLAAIEAAKTTLADGEAQLADAQAQLDQEKANGEAELAAASEKLANGQADYEEALAEFEEQSADAETEIVDGEADLAEAKEDLEALEMPEYYVLDRSSNPGYGEFNDNADRISAIAQVFPVFFFLIAALVCLTTMTRMVEEERLQMGTLKALGYSNWDISKKFLVYASVASVLGTVIGLAIGYQVFPNVIFDAYGSMYNLPPILINYYISYGVISFIVALLGTVMAAYLATRVALKSSPATLMRPKAPKIGKRILLERIPFIWNKLGFIQKVTARNLFRYKQRMLMTVLGVAGCTALILTGFGISDSISDVADLQYGKIMKYDAIVALNTDASETEKADYDEAAEEQTVIDESLKVSQESYTVDVEGVNTQTVTVFIPETTENFDHYVLLNDRSSGQTYSLPEEGTIISEKLAELIDVEKGDTLTLTDTDNKEVEVVINEIVENYTGHYVYMNKDYFETVFEKAPEYTTELLNYSEANVDEEALGSTLLEQPSVLSINFVSDVSGAFEETMGSLGIVTLVLIISAGLLAFVVLYNLTNINVSERERELSTIKVLGFFDKEVTMYIYRENIILTVMGIVVGSLLGILLHSFVLDTSEIDLLMFSPTIQPVSYLYSAVITLVFSGIVMIAMHYKLKKVDMIEALKSVD
ncbi:FtsX-like permease family protein [Carnobacterium pleistocenium]|uniref:FtsX-like permease family protein n=1 Tax=Carnobacterium pleistocenium TaxID=181073 RepID=UPI00054F5F0A|nr:FtsX-like permease family protein [Carnobacterium pleistocenium]